MSGAGAGAGAGDGTGDGAGDAAAGDAAAGGGTAGAPAPELRPGTAAAARLRPGEVARLVPAAEEFRTGPEPAYPGFVLLAARDGVIVEHAARGQAVRYGERAGRAVELEPAQWVPMAPDTLFDLASLTKLFTAVVVVRLAELGAVELDAPLARQLPEFAAAAAAEPAKAGVTVRQLLTHTAGLPAEIDLWRRADPRPGDRAGGLAAVAREPLAAPPGRVYRYSDLGPMLCGALAERAAGASLAELVAEHVTGPLGLADTGFRPPAAHLARVAATEFQPWTGRGVVRGTVHDENAHHLGGVAGHAGLFGTARDVAVFGQALLNGGRYGAARVLGPQWARAMLAPHNADLGREAARGLGWQLDQPSYMAELASPEAFGHCGYTGTSLVADRRTGCLLVLLSNRVHPTRERGAGHAYRRAPAHWLARAAGVRP